MSTTTLLEKSKTMHKLRHPRLVQLMGVCGEDGAGEDTCCMLLVMELVVNGSLLAYIRNNQTNIVSNGINGLIDMASQVCIK